MTSKVSFYCVNYKDDERRERMKNRFKNLEYKLTFVPPVEQNDIRLQNIDVLLDKRVYSIMLQHMDSIRDFVEKTEDDYCIVCEDDILIVKNFREQISELISVYNTLKIDTMLLGYLITFIPENLHFQIQHETKNRKYCKFPNDLWGSQMYLISRRHANTLLEKYKIDFAIANKKIPFSPDWTITKDGNNVIAYPMLAVEEGDTKYIDQCEIEFHKRVFLTNYIEGLHQ